MSDFEAALQAKLARNAEIEAARRDAEAEMDRAKAAREEADRHEAQALAERRRARHAQLADHLGRLAGQLKSASPDDFVVRTGWTQSGEEFVVKISTRGMSPARSLLVELDRDDDEVLARWHTDVGSKLELWRLLEVEPQLLTELVLQVADSDLWRGTDEPPAFPQGA